MTELETGEATPDVTIVMPILAGDADIDAVLSAYGGELDKLGKTWEAILVYDGVKGEVWEQGLRMQAESLQKIRTIGLHKPFGEAVCLSSAFEHALGQVLLTVPQYVQIDPAGLEPMVASLDEGADFVTGWRYPRIDAGLNRIQSTAFNFILRTLVGVSFHDLNCALRLIRREVLEQLTVYGNMYRYLPAIAYNQGFRVDEVQVRHLKERGSGVGLYRPAAYIQRVLDIVGVVFLTKFTHKPLRFFGALGGMFMLSGMIVAMTQVVQWALDESVSGLYQKPLFLIGVLFFILGIQIIGFGLVGEIVIFTQARNVREYRIERVDG